MQGVPLRVAQAEVRQPLDAAGNAPVLRAVLAAEENAASLTGTQQAARGWLDQVRMLRRQVGAAQFAALHLGPRPREAAEGREATLSGRRCRVHGAALSLQ